MKNIFKISTLSIITILALSSCGSSSTTSSNDSTTPTVAETEAARVAAEAGTTVKQGYFVDSGVEGLDYNTTPSGEAGVTDENGSFDYVEGDRVKFSVGNLELGETEPAEDGLVTPESILPDDMSEEDRVEAEGLMLRVLQSVDADNNASNGITIPLEIREEFRRAEFEPTLLLELDEEEILELNPEMKALIDEDGDGVIDVDLDEAILHHEESKTKWANGEKPGATPAIPAVPGVSPAIPAVPAHKQDVNSTLVDAEDEIPELEIEIMDDVDSELGTETIEEYTKPGATPAIPAVPGVSPAIPAVPAHKAPITVPDADVSDTDVPDVEVPNADVPDADVPVVETSDVDNTPPITDDAETPEPNTDVPTTDEVETLEFETEEAPIRELPSSK